jgi:peptide/nickel transport system substrate-binding protein
MRFKLGMLAAVAAAALLAGQPAKAETFRWAFQGDAQSLDPYSLNETFTLGFLGNIYEGLTRRGPNLEIQPALAERWEIVEPTRWRFYLRKGVKFHNGNDFTADDVVFSADRVRAEGSDLKTRIADDVKVEKVDDHTVDFITTQPNPILHFEWDTWYVMDKEWSEANDAVAPTSVTEGTENYAAFNENGTGPFRIKERERDVRSVFVPYDGWWDEPQHNVTEGVFTPISADATRVAALLSGEIDMAYPVPTQDMQRINNNAGTSVLAGPELRTIFLGFDIFSDELATANVKGKNPFKDARVREAFYRAVDIEAIKSKVMRNLSTPSALMISPFLFERSDKFERPGLDIERAKALLAEAGYPDGFSLQMDCPNNRYVNDERICQAVVAMLAKIGVKVDLLAQPKAQYFAKVLGPKYETDFFLLGWTPGSFDSWNVLHNLVICRDATASDGRGKFNLGGYCNPKIDELTDKILSETDVEKRTDMIEQAYRILYDDWGYIPLHQQGLAWGKQDNIDLVQRADNQFMLYYVNKK